MNETADPRSPSGSPGAATTDATKCALCGGPFSAGTLRHYNSLGGGYYCYRCINAAPVAGGSPGAETPPISTVAHAFDSRLCVHCGKRRSAHDNYMSDQCPQGDGVFTTAPPPSVSHPTAEGAAKDLADVRPDDSDEIFKALADLATTLRQQLDDAILTARYQSDVARQADEAREKAEQERDAVIVTAADTIFTTTQTWIEKLAAAQAENAGLRAGSICTGAWAIIAPMGGVLVRNGPDGGELMIYGSEVEAKAKLPKGCTLKRVDVAETRATPTPPQERP
jgi:hypothetical protein